MFYGIPAEKAQAFNQALNTILEVYSGRVLAADMNISLGRNLSFLRDKKFVDSFTSSAMNDQEKSLIWRLHVLCWAATHALHLEGDFVECGVLQGFSSAVLCKYLDFGKVAKTFYLYDTFAGMPEETTSTRESGFREAYAEHDWDRIFTHVQEVFSPYLNVRIVRGVVPATFEEVVPDKIAYLHIDMNSASAEILALEWLFERITPGGVLVLDDFGWLAYQDQMLAEVEFMKNRGYQVLELPTGQGMVLKR